MTLSQNFVKKPDIRSDYAAFDITCSASVDGFNKVSECSISCAAGYTQFTDLELYCDQTKGDFRFIGCGLNGVAKDSENTEHGKFAIQYDDYTKYFESSYAVYSLPDPAKLRDGWYANIKAVKGPVYIYPSYDAALTSTAPKIDGGNDQVILTGAGNSLKITFSGGNWQTSSVVGHKAYSPLKDDAPLNCPTGYAAVHGNYLLETDGFCVQSNGYTVSGTISTLLDTYDTTCSAIPYEQGGGTGTVITDKQFAAMMYDSVHSHKNNLSNFTSQFNQSRTGCKGWAPSNDNEIGLVSGGSVKLHHSSPNPGYCGCYKGRGSYCRNYYQHSSRELMSWDGRYKSAQLNQQNCDNNYNNTTTLNSNFTNHLLSNSSGTIESTFDIENFYHQDQSVPGCDFNNFMNFSGIQSTSTNSTIKFLNGVSTFTILVLRQTLRQLTLSNLILTPRTV